jgi:hypothetical protein
MIRHPTKKVPKDIEKHLQALWRIIEEWKTSISVTLPHEYN